MESSELIKYGVIAGAAYLLYTYWQGTQTATSAKITTTGSGTGSGGGSTATGGSSSTQPTNGSGTGSGSSGGNAQQQQQQAPPAAPNNTFTSSDFGTANWLARVSTAMIGGAGGNGRDLDTWSWYYQNTANGSPISPSLFQYIITDLGGDRTKTVLASDFLNSLVANVQKGLSGLSELPEGLGSYPAGSISFFSGLGVN